MDVGDASIDAGSATKHNALRVVWSPMPDCNTKIPKKIEATHRVTNSTVDFTLTPI